jgi:hypothetical protein
MAVAVAVVVVAVGTADGTSPGAQRSLFDGDRPWAVPVCLWGRGHMRQAGVELPGKRQHVGCALARLLRQGL